MTEAEGGKNGVSGAKTVALFIVLVAFVLGGSLLSVQLWGGKVEKAPEKSELKFDDGLTIGEFGELNGLPNPVLKEAFGLKGKEELEKSLDALGLTREEINRNVTRHMVLGAEEESKDWKKIAIKFGLWGVFLLVVFFLLRKSRIGAKARLGLYLFSTALFGVVLGADPSPMGTVKDTIALYGAEGVIFRPRIIALSMFLLTIFLANKFICSWGCQFGALQDAIFRLNRNNKDTGGIFRQYKPPFVVTNTIRVAFVALFTAVAFTWGFDIYESIDPFKLFKPTVVGLYGGIFLALLIVLSLFLYRPWCHLFCPMGLVGWFVEKASLFRIKVNYSTCVDCGACAKACPSTVMGAVLKRDKKVIPDCFSCGTCISACPTESVSFGFGKRKLPPVPEKV